MFYGQNCFEADKAKGPKRTDQSVCDSWKKCPLCCAHYPFNPKKPHKCYHVSWTNCGELKHVNHRCYIQPIVEKEPQEQEEQDPLEEPLQWQCEDDDNEKENSGPRHALSWSLPISNVLYQKTVCLSPILFAGRVRKMLTRYIIQTPRKNF